MKKYLIITLLLFNLSNYGMNIKIEPAFWWIGMKNPQLQLMVYGDNISESSPEIKYEGVSITGVSKLSNKNYLFIDLFIDKDNTLPGKFKINFRKDNDIVNSFEYELLKRDSGSSDRSSFNHSDVIYLITPDRFANGDPSNDEVAGMKEGIDRKNENGRHGGDIQGIINNLDYVREMGFSSIWLTPVLENNQPDYSYHGYSITDFYHVDPRFGTNELYKKLCEKASQKGIKVIMDMIFNHCGLEHWWMKDLPSTDWMNFNDSVVFTNHRKTVLQDPHVSKPDLQQMVDGWFSKTMPDLNQRNDNLATYLIQNSIWWIEYAGLSGIRVDTYPYPDMHFMSEWTKRVTTEYPNFNIVGEDWSENPAIVSYWQKGKINKNGYVSYLPSLMDFPVQASLIKALNEKEKYNNGGLFNLYEMIANDFQYPNPNNLVVFADNHDIERFYSLVHEDIDLFKLGLTFILTTRGIPQILYGSELLITGETHGQIRSDFPGGWANDKINGFTSEGLTQKQIETQKFVKKLLQWRNSSLVMKSSNLTHYSPIGEVYVYFRYSDQGKIMIVLNMNSEPKKIDLSRYADMIGKSTIGKDILNGSNISLKRELSIPAKSSLIIEM